MKLYAFIGQTWGTDSHYVMSDSKNNAINSVEKTVDGNRVREYLKKKKIIIKELAINQVISQENA